MIKTLVEKYLMRPKRLRDAIHSVMRENDDLLAMLKEAENEEPTNLTWSEGDTWYGWTYSPEKNRYYFDDIGNKSLMGLWEDQWLRESESTKNDIDHSKQAPADVLAGKYGAGVYLAYEQQNHNN
jgi:hypothetical protein